MAEPSIKGTIIAQMVDDLLRLRDGGRLAEADLEARLDGDALRWIEKKILPTDWIPLRVYEQLARVLMDVEGGGDPRHMRRRGRQAGERLMDAGLYRQFESLRRLGARAASAEAYARNLRRILSVQAALLNVGEWTVEPDPDHADRVMIVSRGVEAVPDALVEATTGLLSGVSARAHRSGLGWNAERPEPAVVRYRMDRDVAELD